MWKVLPYILFITIRQITKLQQLLCYTQKKLPLAININMYKCSLKVHTWEQYGFGEAELLLTKCTVVLVATSWWPDYNCLKKMYLSTLWRDNNSVWKLLQKQPCSWLQTPQLILCWISKLCSLMLFEGPCTTLIIQNFKWPTGFCFSKKQRLLNWYGSRDGD